MASDLLAEITASERERELEATCRRLQRRLASKEAKTAELVEAVYQAARDAAVVVGKPTIPMQPKRDGRSGHEEVALLHLTDWQLAKRTATYNMEVCAERVARATDKTLRLADIQRADHPVRICHLLLGGDMVEGAGNIFPGQAFQVESGAFVQLFRAATIIQQTILTLKTGFNKVEVHWVMGNHGRLGRRGDYPDEDNLDRMVYRVAEERTMGVKGVEWHETDGWYTIAEIGAYRALLVHGDEVGGAVSTVEREVTRWAAGVLEPFHDAYIGHRHHCQEFALPSGGRRVFMTPSTESGSEYASRKVKSRGWPAQRLNFVEPVKGRVTAEYLLDLA